MMRYIPKKLVDILCLALSALCLLISTSLAQQQQQQKEVTATDFKTTEHFPEPNQARIKTRMTGREAKSQPNSRLLLMKGLKIETFPETGPFAPEMIVEA